MGTFVGLAAILMQRFFSRPKPRAVRNFWQALLLSRMCNDAPEAQAAGPSRKGRIAHDLFKELAERRGRLARLREGL